jgi:hypothetical protein
MSTTVKTKYHLRSDNTFIPQKPGLNVEVEVTAEGLWNLSEPDTARITAYALERFEKALNAEFRRVVAEREDDAADSSS